LPERVYYGTGLFEQAVVLHEVSHLQTANRVIFSSKMRRRARQLIQGLVLIAWIFIFCGFIFSSRSWLASLGALLYVAASLQALTLLGEEWEVTERALSDVVALEGVGTDERVYLKRLLEVFRWAPLAEVISAPFLLLGPYLRKEKSARVSES
jgi:Zn-dependent membrane protease YugP